MINDIEAKRERFDILFENMVNTMFSYESNLILTSVQNSKLSNVLESSLSTINNNMINWENNFEILYKEIISFFYMIGIKAEITMNTDMKKYINYFAGKKIKYISETTRDDVKRIIMKNLELGNDISFIEQDLKDLYSGFTKARSRTIARTEVAGISNYGILQGKIKKDRDGKIKKKWIPVLDSKTRHSHAAMSDHKAIILDEPFKVGDTKLMFPGDPSGPAKEVINCRCILDYS